MDGDKHRFRKGMVQNFVILIYKRIIRKRRIREQPLFVVKGQCPRFTDDCQRSSFLNEFGKFAKSKRCSTFWLIW